METQEDRPIPGNPFLSETSLLLPIEIEKNVVECKYTHGTVTHTAKLQVTFRGNKSNHQAMVTFHDIGLNSVSNFDSLMNCEAMAPVIQKYCVYHIDAPGQEENAPALPSGFVYPSVDDLADMTAQVLTHFGLKSAICIGSGAGANIFTRLAIKHRSMVEGLILVNPSIRSVGNLAWIGEKLTNLATPITEQVLNYHFSKAEVNSKQNRELVDSHRRHFKQHMNGNNVHSFWREYERRHDINLVRLQESQPEDKRTLHCQTLILVGDLSSFVDEAVEMNYRLNPKRTTFLKMADAGGMVLEEQTFKVSEALTYFLQGLGYIPGVMMSRLARSRSSSSSGSIDMENKRNRTLSGGSVGSPNNNVNPSHADVTNTSVQHPTEKMPLVAEVY